MDNYKIKVKDEAESKEAQELFFELGYSWVGNLKDVRNTDHLSYLCAHMVCDVPLIQMACGKENARELTLPQLRDLVVLKRNDINDATHTDGDRKAFLDSDGKYHYWCFKKNEWFDAKHISFLIPQLRPIKKHLETATGRFGENGEHHLTFSKGSEEKDPALISGAEALRALADGKEVEFQQNENWYSVICSNVHVKCVLNDSYKLRLKPQTIKLELEIPAPYKAKIGGRDDTSFVLNVGRHQYCYKNEEDYTKARDALEAVFDAAVRGTNS